MVPGWPLSYDCLQFGSRFLLDGAAISTPSRQFRRSGTKGWRRTVGCQRFGSWCHHFRITKLSILLNEYLIKFSFRKFQKSNEPLMKKIDQKLNRNQSNNRCQNLNECVQQVKRGSYAFINVCILFSCLRFNLLNESIVKFILYLPVCQ